MGESNSFFVVGERATILLTDIVPDARGVILTPTDCASCEKLHKCAPTFGHYYGDPQPRVFAQGKFMGGNICAIKEIVNPSTSPE